MSLFIELGAINNRQSIYTWVLIELGGGANSSLLLERGLVATYRTPCLEYIESYI